MSDTVSEMLGRSSVSITLDTFSHVIQWIPPWDFLSDGDISPSKRYCDRERTPKELQQAKEQA